MLYLFFRISVVLLSLFIIYYFTDFTEIYSLISNLDIKPIFLAFIIYLVAQIVSAQRFVYVANVLGYQISLIKSIRIHFVSMWFNNFLPTSFGGDAVKASLFKEQMGWSKAINASLIDRIFGLIFVLISIIFLFPFYFYYLKKEIFLLILLFSLFGVMLVLFLVYISKITKNYELPRWIKIFQDIFLDISLFYKKKFIFQQLWVSLIIHFNGIIAYYLIGNALGLSIDFIYYLLAVPLIFMSALLPFSFSGWGIREIAAIVIFNVIGVSSEFAVATSILFGLLLMVVSIPGVIFILLNSKIKEI